MSDTGAIVRDDRGRFVKGAEAQGKPIKSSADARTMAQKRWAKARLAAADRVTREAAAIDPSVNTWADAWGLVTAKQYTALMDSDKPRGDDLLAIGRAIGAMPSDADRMQLQQAQIQPNAQPDIVLALLALVDGGRSVGLIDISTNDEVIDAAEVGG